MRRLFLVTTALAICVSACGDDDSSGSGGSSSSSTSGSSSSTSGSGGSTSGSGGSSGGFELDNCTTTVGDDVPDFFKTYFKCSDIRVDGDEIVIVTKDLPPHKSYYYGQDSESYEAFDTSRGPDYRANPNVIVEQNATVRFPINPTPKAGLVIDASSVNGSIDGTQADEYPMGTGGVALDSVILYNPLAAAGDDIEDEKYTFDIYNGHPDRSGTYHYHTTSMGPLGILEKLGVVTTTTPGEAQVELYGVMCDGTVVMGCTELDGSAPDAAELDPQNGHVHDIVSKDGNSLLTDRYHTHICPTWADPGHKFTPEVQFYNACTVR